MKKLIGIISILLCIFLTACGDATSIGIIGGADGAKSQQKALQNLVTPM